MAGRISCAVCEMARKRKAPSPRRKRMARTARLQSARHWLETFSGKRVVASYARWFGVDLMCAARELQMLGIRFAPKYLDSLRRSAAGRSRCVRDVVSSAGVVDAESAWDHEFAYIADYTEAGLPFGVTLTEMEDLDAVDRQTARTDEKLAPKT